MRIYQVTLDDVVLRNSFRTWDRTCAVCGCTIQDTEEIWVCEDSDLSVTPEQLLCNAIHLCAGCTMDEPGIRQELLAIAAIYTDDDPAHADELRRMAESPIVRMRD
jgi:hypothetical protein